MENVIQKNMKTGLCSGCGVCSTVCPTNFLTICENEYGELRPSEKISGSCIECGLCRKVCPFSEGMLHTVKEVTSEKCYVGWADQYRAEASSGGCCTWFLNKILETKMVDTIVTVRPNRETSNLFEYTICRNKDDLMKCFGSAYYPVSLEKVLQNIKNEKGKIAIVGVPCFVAAIRNLQNTNRIWKDKIAIVVGLVCGHMPTKRMTDALVWSQGKKREEIISCRFRFKEEKRPAWDYGVKFTFEDGRTWKSYGSDDFGFLFWRRLFSQKCCNYCSDVFAEQADITFMDAWLPEFHEEKEGTSMFINRNVLLQSILDMLHQEGNIIEVPIIKAEEAQQKLCVFKKSAGEHKDEERLRIKVRDLSLQKYEKENIIECIRRLMYKEKLRKDNILLWGIIELKDRIVGR